MESYPITRRRVTYWLLLVNFQSIAIDANVQVYTTSNKVMNIQDRLHRD